MKSLKEVYRRVVAGLVAARDMSAQQRHEYEHATKEVLSRMGVAAIRRIHAHVKEFRYYPDHDALKAGVLTKYPPLAIKVKPRTMIRGMFDIDGTLHLEGGGVMFRGMPERPLAAFHAHELAHGIDGINHDLSSRHAWHAVWEFEIVGNTQFSNKGHAVASEGFAEAGAFLLDGEMRRDALVRVIPRTLQFWEQQDLLATGGQ